MSYRTSNLPSTHPVRSLEGLAKQIALPHEYEPTRFPSFPALERTALMGFNQPMALALPASQPIRVGVCRQAAWPVWADQGYTKATGYVVDYLTTQATTGATTAINLDIASMRLWSVGNRAAGTFPGVSGISGLFTYPLLGVDNNTGVIPFTYVPVAAAHLAVVSTVGGVPITNGVSTVKVDWEVWSSPGEVYILTSSNNIASGQTGAAHIITSLPDRSWVRPRTVSMGGSAGFTNYQMLVTIGAFTRVPGYTPSGTTCGNLAVSPPTSETFMFVPLVYPNEFSNSLLPWYATRTTASAFLGTNVSQVLNKGGTILGGRVSPNVVSMFRVESSYVSNLHPAEKAFMGLETGVYTYVPPSTDMSSFWDYTVPTFNGLVPNAPVFRLDNDALQNVMFITAGSVAESLACNVDWHIEFRTSSALFQIGLCNMTLESLHQAQLALTHAGFFFDNPDHKRILGDVIKGVRKVLPYADVALSTFAPGMSAASKAAYQLGKKLVRDTTLSRRPNTNAKPTSGAASGITPNDKKKKQGRGKSKQK